MNFLPFTRGGRAQGAASSASEGSRVASRSGSRALGAAAASFAMVAASLGPIASGAQAADARYYDGSSSERAAASLSLIHISCIRTVATASRFSTASGNSP